MPSHIQGKMSENEQMYLVTIAKLQNEGHESPVALSELANALSVLPVSVNQMIRKLEESGLVKYYPYKGVEFTPSGQQFVRRILRYRRLWEVFLVTHLQMELEDADALACRIEHATTDDVANRLAFFLDNPTVCFHGYPIQQTDDELIALPKGIPLEKLNLGQSSPVMQINANSLTTSFLAGEGILPGVRVSALAIGSRGDMLLETENGRAHLSAEMIAVIIVGQPE